jgi:hypothetical protein
MRPLVGGNVVFGDRAHRPRNMSAPVSAVVSASSRRTSGESAGIDAEGVIAVETVLAPFAGFGSPVAALIVAVFVIEPDASRATRTTSVNCAVADAAKDAAEHVTVPPEPAAGVTQVNEGPLV